MRFLRPSSRAGLAWRTLVAAIVIVGCSAGAVATAALLQVDSIATVISVHLGIKSKELTLPKAGAPETILLIGSDHRAGGGSFRNSNTDTILLVHLNAGSSTINVMSIPRDLKVDIPSSAVPSGAPCVTSSIAGGCAEKINSAYRDGGYSLLIQTIKDNVFPQLKINHIVDTNFRGFSDLVDAIGCVYTDVDHRYYNVSAPDVANNFSSIDIEPGYQRLCGDDESVSGALPFVRFRHTDSDLVREARQQDFLRWARENFTTTQLFHDRTHLLKILADYSTFDRNLQSQGGLLDLFNLLLNANGGTLKQVAFPANLSQSTIGDDFVLADPAAEAGAYAQFMRPTPKPAANSHAHRSTPVKTSRSPHGRSSRSGAIDTAGLFSDPADGRAQAKALTPDMPVYYPTLLQASPTGKSQYCTELNPECLDDAEPGSAYAGAYPRQYLVRKPDGVQAHAYFMTVVINANEGEYYGIQGLQWLDPPILRNPQAIKVVRGRRYEIFADDGGHITDVAFRAGPDVYWVSNTLTSELSNSQMMGIAESMTQYG